MAESLEMSLDDDDFLKSNRKSARSSGNFRHIGRRRSRGNGVASGPGPTRRIPRHVSPRPTPYFMPQAVHVQEMVISGETDSDEAGTKLYISNLDYGVTNEDIKVLFTEIGELKSYSIHYDKSGRSKGTAEVVYVRQSDALTAMKRYNNVLLDGAPMKLEVVGVRVVKPFAMPTGSDGILGRTPVNTFLSNGKQERTARRSQEPGGNGVNRVFNRGQERGRGEGTSGSSSRGPNEKVSAAQLDAELERYHLDAMHIY